MKGFQVFTDRESARDLRVTAFLIGAVLFAGTVLNLYGAFRAMTN